VPSDDELTFMLSVSNNTANVRRMISTRSTANARAPWTLDRHAPMQRKPATSRGGAELIWKVLRLLRQLALSQGMSRLTYGRCRMDICGQNRPKYTARVISEPTDGDGHTADEGVHGVETCRHFELTCVHAWHRPRQVYESSVTAREMNGTHSGCF
jgi:hypothetical protein